MKIVSISGSVRQNVGKKDAKKLRLEGKVPCVLYGGEEQVHFYTDERSFKNIVFTPEACFIEITIGEKVYKTIIKEVQFHPVTDKILHADFYEIKEDKPIKMNIPVKIVGTSPGVLKGGKLDLKFRKLLVKALPSQMPDYVILNIEKLDIGNSIKVADLRNENYEILEKDNVIVVQILKSRSVVEEATTTEKK